MQKILYSSPYIPAELIKAQGLEPVSLIPDVCGEEPVIRQAEGMCAFMRMFCCSAADVSGAAAILLTSTCDQMRRGSDILANESATPVFLMDVPAVWGVSSAHNYYRSELERLSRFLETVGGESLSKRRLAGIMARGDERACAGGSGGKGGIALAVLGGPVAAPDRKLIDLVEQFGGRIVLNGLEGGERTLPGTFDRRSLQDDPLGVLADSYFGAIPDVFRRPNSGMYRWLERELVGCGARGVILLRYVWCDLWHAEVARIRDWLKVPLLDIDLHGDDAIPRNRTKIEAFLEGLRMNYQRGAGSAERQEGRDDA